jgi:polyphosphate glucokinase
VSRAIGVDIGGSGIKAAVVDIEKGDFEGKRVRIETPHPATPEAVVATTHEAIAGFPDDLPVGIGFPAAIIRGTVMTAAHVDPGWIGFAGTPAFEAGLERPCTMLNDADAAGLAEMRFGQGKGEDGVVAMLTLGTGIGSALFLNGQLVPNTEFGHMEIRGADAESRAAASRRKADDLSWSEWASLVDEVIHRVDLLIWPELVILGGGVSRRAEKFVPLLTARPRIEPAHLQNRAGIVGAACRASEVL